MAPVWSGLNRAILAAKSAPGLILNRAATKNVTQSEYVQDWGYQFVEFPLLAFISKESAIPYELACFDNYFPI